jgi:RimJ/RimL family protein N-acetyltransferase
MDFDFSREIVLQNDWVLLRPLGTPDHHQLLPVATMHTDLVKYSPYQLHTPELLLQYIEDSLAERQKGFRYPFVIYDKGRKACAGSTSIANVSNKDRRLEIGWTWLGKPFQQTGLNRACKYLLLSFAFEELQFERVEFKTDGRNAASRTAIEKIGGRYEGTLRSHTVMLDGFRRDTVYYSILKQEWPEVKERVFKQFAVTV